MLGAGVDLCERGSREPVMKIRGRARFQQGRTYRHACGSEAAVDDLLWHSEAPGHWADRRLCALQPFKFLRVPGSACRP